MGIAVKLAMCSAMVALALGASAANSSARAEIKDYMILRLLYLDTSCGVDHLELLEPDADGNQRFYAKCRNVGSYPDGLEVLCTDPDDDRACKVTTPEKTFKHLELLRQR
ncbi:hypothetical protein [Hyphomicrobium sp. D-2]|uniref:hypothetical protein n=1 Tax=Hyphomicrobium sp. D-2 TaxID=3041621 RepID=UPI0024573219|nr:hypothetical protein [Hyphomicrobium sp. D-2]MDH4981033.1 hypothetical protein [Hyphomicrobium sp. D-2]